jgi:hypothetical protein
MIENAKTPKRSQMNRARLGDGIEVGRKDQVSRTNEAHAGESRSANCEKQKITGASQRGKGNIHFAHVIPLLVKRILR